MYSTLGLHQTDPGGIERVPLDGGSCQIPLLSQTRWFLIDFLYQTLWVGSKVYQGTQFEQCSSITSTVNDSLYKFENI